MGQQRSETGHFHSYALEIKQMCSLICLQNQMTEFGNARTTGKRRGEMLEEGELQKKEF